MLFIFSPAQVKIQTGKDRARDKGGLVESKVKSLGYLASRVQCRKASLLKVNVMRPATRDQLEAMHQQVHSAILF
jgi:hypothetical protein